MSKDAREKRRVGKGRARCGAGRKARSSGTRSIDAIAARLLCVCINELTYAARRLTARSSRRGRNLFFCLSAVRACGGCLMYTARRNKNRNFPARVDPTHFLFQVEIFPYF